MPTGRTDLTSSLNVDDPLQFEVFSEATQAFINRINSKPTLVGVTKEFEKAQEELYKLRKFQEKNVIVTPPISAGTTI